LQKKAKSFREISDGIKISDETSRELRKFF